MFNTNLINVTSPSKGQKSSTSPKGPPQSVSERLYSMAKVYEDKKKALREEKEKKEKEIEDHIISLPKRLQE